MCSQRVATVVDHVVHFGERLLIVLVARSIEIGIVVEVELGKRHVGSETVGIAKHVVGAKVLLDGLHLRNYEVEYLFGGVLLRQIACFNLLCGLNGDVAEGIEEHVIDLGAKEAHLSAFVGLLFGQHVETLVAVSDADVAVVPQVVGVLLVRGPVVLVHVDVKVAPAYTDALGCAIEVAALFLQVEVTVPGPVDIAEVGQGFAHHESDHILVLCVDGLVGQGIIYGLVEVGAGGGETQGCTTGKANEYILEFHTVCHF